MVQFPEKEKYTYDDLVALLRILRQDRKHCRTLFQ